MLNLGLTEILFIVVLTILVVAPDDIPKMLRYLGRQYGKLMRASDELRRAFMIEAERDEATARAAELKKKREEARRRAEELRAKALASKPGEAEAPLPRPEGFPTLVDAPNEGQPIPPPLGPPPLQPPEAAPSVEAAPSAPSAEEARS